MFSEEHLITFFSAYAYEPLIVYFFIIAMLTASSFGLPIPEEVTLVSAGIVGYFALHPELYPPPTDMKANAINPWTLASVCFFAVLLSDYLIYNIGRFGGYRIRQSLRFGNYLQSPAFLKVHDLLHNHGIWMVGGFRFMPGLRFPAHLTCGMVGLPQWKFLLVDSIAVLISVPTQVLLVAFYGDTILAHIKQFKVTILVILLLIGIYFILRKTTLLSRLRRV